MQAIDAAENDSRVCMKLKSSGQVIRFGDMRTLKLIEHAARLLEKKQR